MRQVPISDHLIRRAKVHEGFRHSLYLCPAKKWTIGYGHNVEADPRYRLADFKNGITREVAESFLIEDLKNARDDLFRRFPEFIDLKPARRDALINLVFNMGIGSFSGFRRTIRAIRHGDFEEAKRELFDSKWRREDVAEWRSNEVGEQLRTGVYA